MAGAGVRVFQPGEVLTASLVNSYLQDQVVARFTSAAARDAAFGGVGQPTLEEGRVCYLESTNELQYYSGTAWVSISAEAIIGNVEAKGDLVVGTALTTVARLAVGSNGRVLTADSTTETGLAWVIPSVLDESVTEAKLGDGAVTSAKIANGTIVNADVNASAAIAYSKLNLAGSVSATDLAAGPPMAGFRSVINSQVGTAYTLALSDLGKLVELNNLNPITLTVALDSNVNFAVGDRIDILQTGAGQVTILGQTGIGGVVVQASPGLKLRTQWSAATLIKRDSNSWVAIGDLSA